MRPSATSLAKFAVAAALLFWLWSVMAWSDGYARVVIWSGNPLIQILTDFHVSRVVAQPAGVNFYIADSQREILVPLQPRELFSGLIPFLALMIATPGFLSLKRVRAVLIGVASLYAFHISLTILGPYLATEHVWWVNKIIDVSYGFVALIGYVALPFLLWFMLTRGTTGFAPQFVQEE